MRTFRRSLTLVALVGLVAIPAGLPSLAQSVPSSVPTRVEHRQSVLVQVDPNGAYGDAIVVTQLLVTGSGTTELVLEDQATKGLRNLEGFEVPRVSGSTVTWNVAATPEGVLRRTVAEVDAAQVPVSIEVTYELDGEVVTPRQLVGESGHLRVTYTVTNLTVEEREVRYFDGQGRPQTATAEVAVPMGGTFSTTLDSRFTGIESAEATAIAGDGSGNTVVNGGFTLFQPAGAATQSLTWTAHVSDAIVPEAVIQILPVSSRTSPSVAAGQAQLSALLEGFKTIVNGAAILNSNLIRLGDGAGQLAEGLSGSAAPGARELADGLQGSAAPGAKALSDALNGQIAPGAKQLSDAVAAAANGAVAISGGINELYETIYGPKGDPADPSTWKLRDVLDLSRSTAQGTFLALYADCFGVAFPTPAMPANPAATSCQLVTTAFGGSGAAGTTYGLLAGPPAAGFTGGVVDQINGKESDVEALNAGAGTLATRLADGIPGAGALADGVARAGAGAKQLSDGLATAAAGSGALADGLDDAADGATTVADGASALSEAIATNLIGGTAQTAGDRFGLPLAQLNAADQRGIANEGMLFGVVEGADATAVYKFEIAGLGGESAPPTSTLGLIALIALALAAVLGFAVRARVNA